MSRAVENRTGNVSAYFDNGVKAMFGANNTTSTSAVTPTEANAVHVTAYDGFEDNVRRMVDNYEKRPKSTFLGIRL